MTLRPSKLSKKQLVDLGKATLYVSVSAGLSYLISAVTNNPDLFGPLTPVINIGLVALKKAFTKD